MTEEQPPLGRKIATDLARAAVGSVPVIGRALEGILDVVRDIRISRVEKYVVDVEMTIYGLDPDVMLV
jgi:hypothetical protein